MNMNRLIEGEEGYTLVESLVAMALFVTVVLALFESVNYLVVMSGRDDLKEASLIAQTEIANVSDDSLFAMRRRSGHFMVERQVQQHRGYAEVTISVCPSINQERKLATITRLIATSNEK